MLLFNHNKEFIGIDQNDLKALGFDNLSQVLAETDEFANMFVKKPGYIHNFQHINWIDFVECADSLQSAKVIINANAKNFQCFMSVEVIYLKSEPSAKAYIVELHNIKELTDNETEYATVDFLEHTTPESSPMEAISIEPLIDLDIEKEEFKDDLKIDLEISPEIETTSLKTKKVKTLAVYNNAYTFDPLIASNELGLPVDLIEEFIEDFVAQAKEFKDNIYKALHDEDTANLKILSHKLKGVAANLRIEDALESLTIINTSSNNDELKTEVDTFYKIIAKFSSEQTESTQPLPPKIEEELDMFSVPKEISLDDFELSFKDEKVPDYINIPELADDDFSPQIEENEMFYTPIITYSKENIASEIGLDQETFNELFVEYILEAKELSNSITTAIQTEDAATWKHLAIQLKGMSDNMRVQNLSKGLETLINTQEASIAKIANEQVIESIHQLSKVKE